jgi:hypothetical protein
VFSVGQTQQKANIASSIVAKFLKNNVAPGVRTKVQVLKNKEAM